MVGTKKTTARSVRALCTSLPTGGRKIPALQRKLNDELPEAASSARYASSPAWMAIVKLAVNATANSWKTSQMKLSQKKRWLTGLLLSVLLSASPAQATGCIGLPCTLTDNNPLVVTAAVTALSLYAAVSSFTIITDTSKENSRRHSQLTHDDASYFIASDGEQRGAHFESALKAYRLESQMQEPSVSDMAFAQLIVTSRPVD